MMRTCYHPGLEIEVDISRAQSSGRLVIATRSRYGAEVSELYLTDGQFRAWLVKVLRGARENGVLIPAIDQLIIDTEITI